MVKTIDIVVLGATGYTGKCVVKMLATLTKEEYYDITWAIAGRSKEKLQDLATELCKADVGVKNLTIIESDIKNEASLKKMFDMTKVVINCTGPNCLLSPPIVKACIETGTHYVDISAEMLHMLKLQQDYHRRAEEAGVLVIPSCGFSSTVLEFGMVFLQRQFEGTLYSMECYAELLLPSWIPGKIVLHNGTWTSTVYVMETFKKHWALWREMFPPIEPEPEEMQKSFFHRHNRRFWFPAPGPEWYLGEMSQRYLYQTTGKKPVYLKEYTTFQYCFQFIIIPIMYIYYYLCYFKCFSKLLIKLPRLLTFGMVSEAGPSNKTRQNTKFRYTFNGKGWDVNDDLKSKPLKSLSVKVTGQDPGYDSTALAIIMCAITILKERSNMPKGGVIMPGAAFYKTDIIDRLTQNNGFKFEVLNNNRIQRL